MSGNVYVYIAVMAGVSFVIRVLPLTLLRKQLKNRFLKSFLYYIPYVTLSVMTFPAILHATQSTGDNSRLVRRRTFSCFCRLLPYRFFTGTVPLAAV
ncbi:AzlD domain-containing protein [Treponema sp.]|uniref:AzlD domain-containing protein n=1 Tax=Treponema sp. TaxID=166 RepID=UPI00257E006D|nr:AzlD domain-containing protein [Treponema sp.]